MATALTETEILGFLHAVETGEVILTALREPQEVYMGEVAYSASNGWELAVFSDANEWDYLAWIRTADGRECEFDTMDEQMPQVRVYEPSEEVAWSRYRLPGPMKERCVRCGQLLTRATRSELPYVCRACCGPIAGAG